MSNPNELEELEHLVQQFAPGGLLVRAWELTGGISATVTAVEVALAGGTTKRFVVRVHGDADFLRNPDIARDEFKLLETVYSAGIPVPRPVFVDETSRSSGRPCLVVEFVEGESIFEPKNVDEFIDRFTEQLVRIHEITPETADLSFLARREESIGHSLDQPLAAGDDTPLAARIREALRSAPRRLDRNDPVLLHGDYWPGNLLWRDGRIAAVLDWEDARVGDPLADLANSRLEILWALGDDSMHRFTEQYLSKTNADFTALGYWDLAAAMNPALKMASWSLDADIARSMHDGLARFVERAIASLSVR